MPPKHSHSHSHKGVTAPSSSAAQQADEQKAAEARVEQLMKKSIVSQNPEKLYTTYSNGGILSKEQKVAAARKKSQEKRDTLSQWYGMKRFSKNMSKNMRQDLELLRYRNFLNKDTSHLSSAKGGSKKIAPYFELGYFTDASQKKRKQSRRFADEMLKDDTELRERVQQVAKREVKRRRKVNEKAAKKLEQSRQGDRRRKGKRAGGSGRR